jgi:hypothetical protein
VAAADLARHGLTGQPTVLEGRFGFLQAFCGDRAHPDAVVRGLGTDWELPRVVFKPHPCNHFTHAGVDAALRLRAQGSPPPTLQRSSWASPNPSCARSPSHPRPRHGRPPGTTRRSAAATRSPSSRPRLDLLGLVDPLGLLEDHVASVPVYLRSDYR